MRFVGYAVALLFAPFIIIESMALGGQVRRKIRREYPYND